YVNCTQINQKQSVDIVEIDAASNNGVDEIRELKRKVSLVPSIGKYKIYIIDEVHMLTIGSFNALLKTLEEPPAHIIFILATTEPHKIPETILSRCQKFEFKRIDDKSMLERLKYICEKEKINIEDDALNEIVRFSSGGMRDAISMLEQSSVYAEDKITISDINEINGTLPHDQMKELIDSIIAKDLTKIFLLLGDYDNNGKNLIKLVEEIINFIKNIIIYKNIPTYSNNNISREIYKEFIDKTDIDELFKMILEINNSLNEMKNFNNPRLVFELLMVSLIKNNDVKKLPETPITKNQPQVDQIIEIEKPIEKIQSKVKEKEIGTQPDVNNKSKESQIPNLVINKKDDELEKIKKIRVNNTFVKPSKTILNKLKIDIEKARDYILDKNYSKMASILLDAKIPAASAENIIFVYPSDSMEKTFNNNILKIEEFVSKIFNSDYKIIALNKEEWNFYRKEFKSKTTTYVYINETPKILEYLKKQTESNQNYDEIHNLFGDIIEYNN
ncbi:MAG: DNA polymerase III subunit gamma/tau, partial [Bacilli bacterium]|nr:DNA polymerase III subunit gamma/tau [Bacilli bacterium]